MKSPKNHQAFRNARFNEDSVNLSMTSALYEKKNSEQAGQNKLFDDEKKS